MGFRIDGSQYSAEVNSDGQLHVKAITETEFEFASEANGQAYTWSSGTYDPAAGDTILLIKNTSSTRELHIDEIWLSSDTDTRVVVHMPTAIVTPTGTTVTGVNLNRKSGNSAEATAIKDETNNTQGDIVWSGEIMAADAPFVVQLNGALILGTNDSIGVDYVADVGACDVTISGHYT